MQTILMILSAILLAVLFVMWVGRLVLRSKSNKKNPYQYDPPKPAPIVNYHYGGVRSYAFGIGGKCSPAGKDAVSFGRIPNHACCRNGVTPPPPRQKPHTHSTLENKHG